MDISKYIPDPLAVIGSAQEDDVKIIKIQRTIKGERIDSFYGTVYDGVVATNDVIEYPSADEALERVVQFINQCRKISEKEKTKRRYINEAKKKLAAAHFNESFDKNASDTLTKLLGINKYNKDLQ